MNKKISNESIPGTFEKVLSGAHNVTVQLLLLTVSLTCQPAYASEEVERNKQRCDDSLVNLVGNHFNLSDFSYPGHGMYPRPENGGSIAAGVCKVWPRDTTKTIAIFAYDEGVQYEKELLVTLVDLRKNKVMSSYEGKIQEDAALTIGEDSFRIDTARYDFAPSVRAFGLDVTTVFSQGCVDGGAGAARTLFVPEGKHIRPVLEDFYLSTWRFLEGGPSCMASHKVVIEDFSFSIGIGKTSSNGYADLMVTVTSSQKSKPAFRYEMHYDGKRYVNEPGAALYKWEDSRP